MSEVVYAQGLNPANIKWARERTGMSSFDVMRSLGVSMAALTRWETSDTDGLPLKILEQMRHLYSVPLALFFIADARQFQETLAYYDHPEMEFESDTETRDDALEELVERAFALIEKVLPLVSDKSIWGIQMTKWLDDARKVL